MNPALAPEFIMLTWAWPSSIAAPMIWRVQSSPNG